jgi:GNAT superfamily N-acetyltransferase
VIEIKPFTYSDAEYAALVVINDAIDLDRPLTIADFQHEDHGRGPDADKYAARWLAHVDSVAVGHAQVVQDWQRTDSTRYFALFEVLPAYQWQGVGSALLATVCQTLRAQMPYALEVLTKEDRPDAIDWLRKRDFKQIQREPMSALDVQRFDASRFTNSAEKVQANDIALISLDQLAQSDPNYKIKLFDMMWEIISDVPGSHVENRAKPGYDYFEQTVMGDPTFTPDAWFVALESTGNNYVGTCNVHPKSLEGHWNNGLTGVLRKYRRIGLATALKVRAIEHVKGAGGIVISTSNDENNPMYQLNMQLGFEPRPALLTFERT